VLHIMDLPRNLRRRVPSEVNTMHAFLTRHLARLDYLQACKPRRAQLLKVQHLHGISFMPVFCTNSVLVLLADSKRLGLHCGYMCCARQAVLCGLVLADSVLLLPHYKSRLH